MSYISNDKKLEHLAKILPAEAMATFCDGANTAESLGLEHNDCIKAGWDEVYKGWYRPGGKRYTRKPVMTDAERQAEEKRKQKKPVRSAAKFGDAQVLKVDESLGLVFGFAIVCKENGEDYFDLQEDHIPEDAMLKAATDFMENSRLAADMHPRDENKQFHPDMACGSVPFAFPLTSEIAKSLGIETERTGLLIAMKPPSHILAKYKSGEYSGFSMGGRRIVDEAVQ